MNRLTITILILGSSLFFGCNQSARKLIGDYSLERFEENKLYYLTAPGDLSGGGVFDGTIQEIGWDHDWILARVTRLYRGDASGWYVLNLKTKQVIGPMQESEMRTNSALSKIECRNPDEVFSGRTTTEVHKQ